jgi:hypothetical protein
MPELERRLTQLGRELDYPPTPDLGGAVASRLRAVEPERAKAVRPRLFPPAGLRRALVLALVALLLLAGTVFAAVPSARDAVLEFFGLQGATVQRIATLPTAPPEQRLDLGRRTTLERARDRIAFEPRSGLPRARTTRLGLLVSEFRGDIHPDFVGKLAGPGTRIERLTIDGRPAIWIEGAQHFFFYRAPDGNIVEDELRLAQNVLLLERGPLLVRLEGALDRAQAVEIARSLR